MKEPVKRGFATLSKEARRAIASKGGKAAHQQNKAHKFTPEQAREAGRKGGIAVSEGRAGHDHMAKIGRRGGETVSQDRAHMSEIGTKGGRAYTAPTPPETPS